MDFLEQVLQLGLVFGFVCLEFSFGYYGQRSVVVVLLRVVDIDVCR